MTKRSEIEALRFRLRKTKLYNKILIMRLRMLGVRDIIELNFDERYNPNHDPKNGQFAPGSGFKRKTLHLPKKEYAEVNSAINNVFHTRFEGKSIGALAYGVNEYHFEIKEFGDYNIFAKRPLLEEDDDT